MEGEPGRARELHTYHSTHAQDSPMQPKTGPLTAILFVATLVVILLVGGCWRRSVLFFDAKGALSRQKRAQDAGQFSLVFRALF